MDDRPACFVRVIEHGERIEDIVDEAKGRTWTAGSEHVLIRTDSGERWLVRGGRDGVEFTIRREGHGPALYVTHGGREVRVARIIGHTHPRVTGPSDLDLTALTILGQKRSDLFEIGGDPGGTLIRPKSGPTSG